MCPVTIEMLTEFVLCLNPRHSVIPLDVNGVLVRYFGGPVIPHISFRFDWMSRM